MNPGPESIPPPGAIAEAAARIAPYIRQTPVLTSASLDGRCGASLFLKCENLQRVGAFKFRGATNALLQLSEEERRRGVVTHSSGNHGQALAKAGQLLGIPVSVVMPRTAPTVKQRATADFGARVVLCEPTLAARESTVNGLIEAEGLALIHPYDDWRVIAGQGTAAWELLDQAGPLDMIVAPVGGGGLLTGTILAARDKAPGVRVHGAEPAVADDARRSLIAGSIQPSPDPKTVADGLRSSLGLRPFAVLRTEAASIGTATEPEILEAMQFTWERAKVVIEPSAAVPLAALFNGSIPARGLRVGVIVSGGNVDTAPMFHALGASA
jgi:threonine dehydratase